MKNLKRTSILGVFIMTSLWASSATNLLTNGDFESGTLTGWTSGKSMTVQTSQYAEGVRAVQADDGDAYFSQNVVLNVGKTYELSFYGKNELGEAPALVAFQYDDGGYKYAVCCDVNNKEWEQYKIRFVPQKVDTVGARVGFAKKEGKKVWLDDFVLIENQRPDTLLADKDIISSTLCGIDKANRVIHSFPADVISFADFIASLTISEGARVVVFPNDHKFTYPDSKLNTGDFVRVYAESGVYDEYSVVSNNAFVIGAELDAILDTENLSITNINPTLTVEAFKESITVEKGYQCDLYLNDELVSDESFLISTGMSLRVYDAYTSNEYSLELRAISDQNRLIAVSYAEFDDSSIFNIVQGLTIGQFYSLIELPIYASADIQMNGEAVDSTALVTNECQLVITAENGSIHTYSMILGEGVIGNLMITDEKLTLPKLELANYELSGKTDLHILDGTSPLVIATINLRGEDTWVFFDSIKPSVVNKKHLPFVRVEGQPAVLDVNIRLVQYKLGTVIIPHTPSYEALTAYADTDYAGASKSFGNYTYYGKSLLGEMDDKIASFKLRRGYMATFAQNEDGTGFSKVYIADQEDKEIASVPVGLAGSISYVRVIPWRWPHKKGYPHGVPRSDWLNCSWHYNWNNASTSTLDVEYVPMRHNKGWNKWSNIDNKVKSTHVLGFNEPDRPDQANMSVDKALELWPNILKSGLRVGSPSPSDGGLNWLFNFMDRAEKLNYRVDFIAMHYYLGCQSADNLYSRLKYVSDRCGKRPVWVTEWNNGANWTKGCIPSSETAQANKIKAFIEKMDAAKFVERYSIFDYLGGAWNLFKKNAGDLDASATKAAIYYRDNKSPLAYREANAYDNKYEIPNVEGFVAAEQADLNGMVRLTWDELSTGLDGFVVERSNGITADFVPIYTSSVKDTVFVDKLPSYGVYRYRVAGYIDGIGHGDYSKGLKSYYIPENFFNVALNKEVKVSSQNSSYVGEKAIDGNISSNSSRWVVADNTTYPHWIEIDFGQEYTIGMMRMWSGWDGYNTPISTFAFEAWNGTTWVPLITANGSAHSYYVNTFEAVTTQKVRLYITKASDNKVRLYELEVYGHLPDDSSIDIASPDQKVWPYYESGCRYLNLIGLYHEADVQVYDVQGKLLRQTKTLCDVEVGDLPDGLYVIKIDGIRTVKFIK